MDEILYECNNSYPILLVMFNEIFNLTEMDGFNGKLNEKFISLLSIVLPTFVSTTYFSFSSKTRKKLNQFDIFFSFYFDKCHLRCFSSKYVSITYIMLGQSHIELKQQLEKCLQQEHHKKKHLSILFA